MNLNNRQHTEAAFHDHYAKTLNLREIVLEDNFSLGAQENRFALNQFGPLKNKKILDLGCGSGETAVFFALKGAWVEAVDVSLEMTKFGEKLAKKYKVSKHCHFAQMPAEKLIFSKNYFDFIFGNGVLHHLNIKKAAPQLARVLKPGGKAVFIDPLAYNPVIEVYRHLAKEVRSPDEGPLTFDDIKPFHEYFSNVAHQESGLTTLLIFIWFFLGERVNPSKERYWKKIMHLRGRSAEIMKTLIAVDKVLLKHIFPLRFLCWNMITILEK